MLNNREKEILNTIINYIKENGYAPSVREICEITGIKSTSTVHFHLKGLQNKGFIERKAKSPRALKILKK